MSGIQQALLVCSVIYLAALPVGLPHLMFAISFLYICLYIAKYKISLSTLWLIPAIIFAVSQLQMGCSWKALVNNISSMMMFPIAYEILRNCNYEKLIKIGVKFIKISVPIFFIETITRLCLATLYPAASGIYRYKFHSFMFQDTNFNALALLVIIFFIKYLSRFHNISLKVYYRIAVILLLLTVSRAAILAYILCELYFYKINDNKFARKLFFRTLVFGAIGVVLGTSIFLLLYNDPSFKSKLYILELAEGVYSDLDPSVKYLGVGYDLSSELLGIYPHNVIFLYFMEIGIVGLIFKAIFIYYISLKTRYKFLIIFIPFFIAAQSAVGYGVHYLYVVGALIAALELKKQNYEKDSILNY